MTKKWYEEWFETNYYNILYKRRNNSEAELFLNNLITHINPKKTDIFIDIACGEGRHTNYIGKLGYEITGIDLSKTKINKAQQNTNKNVFFAKYDMRNIYKKEYFDYVLNLFTSFGYFEEKSENQLVLKNFNKTLKKKR